MVRLPAISMLSSMVAPKWCMDGLAAEWRQAFCIRIYPHLPGDFCMQGRKVWPRASLGATSANKIHSLKNPVKTGMFIACRTLPAFYKPAATLYNSLIQATQIMRATGLALPWEHLQHVCSHRHVCCRLPLSRS
ncbi:hypothetical protein Mfla_1818 [Methylobacillus flagellatus KT]|uniref:Uncharacterized protein n=1 Tax=Methylobacillus flagellatus (strain ATCC 51484 / DSM 6875 / VKM B-1610 / KT) TaxID=265072 RepID=Q1H0A2_METFK|nr:hypothetical protein Mfla_1818 [Methylobacillus flagellatus KT]